MIFEPGFFSDETIYLMAGVAQMDQEKQAMFPEALALLRDDRLNSFRIDIETDSTIAIDEADAAARWGEYMKNLQGIIGEVTQITETAPEFITPVIETALNYARALRTGRSVEGQLEKAMDDWELKLKQMKENPQPPPPDPALIRAQVDQQKAQQDYEIKSQEIQLKGQEQQFTQYIEQQKLMQDSHKTEGELAVKHEANMIDAQEQLTRSQIDKIIADMDIFQAQLKNQLEAQKNEFMSIIESKRLALEEKSIAMTAAEKMAEESRLAKDQVIEVAKIKQKDREIDVYERIEDKKAKAQKNKPKPAQK